MIVVPAAKSGLLTAVILGVARIAGETAPILLLAGGGDRFNLDPFSGLKLVDDKKKQNSLPKVQKLNDLF